MLNFLSNKEKGILGAITLFGVGAIIAKGLYDYSTIRLWNGSKRD